MVKRKFQIYFSDFFNVNPETLREYGAFNISLINDLPLFIDPFLLFNSEKQEYQDLHAKMIGYVQFLKAHSKEALPPGIVKSWFHFPEIKENWLGFSKTGNSGRGLGSKFANSLKRNLTTIFQDFGDEGSTGTHLEKLTLVKNGVGKDQISDFACNLICGYLAEYTEAFAKKNIHPSKLGKFQIEKHRFNMQTQTWAAKQFTLPKHGQEFVLLTPVDMLTKDEAWINFRGLVEDYSEVLSAVDNVQLRDKINRFFVQNLPVDANRDELALTLEKVVAKYPQLLDAYIKLKEVNGGEARVASAEKIQEANEMFVMQLSLLVDKLDKTKFYETEPNSFDAGLARINFLKQVIEHQDGYKLFMVGGKPIKRESDLQIMFKLTWFASAYDANAEVNNGRGPADFVISYGSADKTVIELKLAGNKKLEDNLLKQAEIYASASKATHVPIKAIMFFTSAELAKVVRLLTKHGLSNKKEIILIDATPNKPSASKA
ncbi:MAG: hypothetical protein P4L91_21030 [Burkholderiaceae bacterium]|nr:hypothetical protein [Burkholderiaceae bacterium]